VPKASVALIKMSNHLRHCPKHRKPLPCAHCALTARPAQAPPPSIAIAAAPEQRGRGRPRKYEDDATKQAAYRERLATRVAAKRQDADRRTALAEILKRVKHGMFDSKSAQFGHEIKKDNRLRLARLRDELKEVSLGSLKEYLETLETAPDLNGRLRNERSGEAERIGGQSEIERIIGARQYDVSLGESDRQDPKLSAGFRSRPEGSAPDEFEQDGTADDANSVRSGFAIGITGRSASEKQTDAAIARIIGQMIYKPSIRGAQCLFCDEVFSIELAAENHLLEQYEQGRKHIENQRLYLSGILQLAARTGSIDASLLKQGAETLEVHHHKSICREASRRKFGNIVTDRLKKAD